MVSLTPQKHIILYDSLQPCAGDSVDGWLSIVVISYLLLAGDFVQSEMRQHLGRVIASLLDLKVNDASWHTEHQIYGYSAAPSARLVVCSMHSTSFNGEKCVGSGI